MAVGRALVRTLLSRAQRAFIAWFGVRGVGSVYYLAFALSHGVPAEAARSRVKNATVSGETPASARKRMAQARIGCSSSLARAAA